MTRNLACEVLEFRQMLAGDSMQDLALPDLIPLVDVAQGYLHGWTIDKSG
jgi:hypothetical protein